MRRFLYLLIFVLIVCLVQTSEARKLALLVGVDDYANVPSLKCCVNDMKTLKKALIKIGFKEDDIQMLVTGSGSVRDLPTKKKIEQSISELLSQAQPSDMVFLAFSGHGAQEGNNVYFCPPFADPEDLDNTCVSITKIMDDLANSNAKFKWMVVDACRNDPTQGAKGIGGKGLRVVPTPPAGIALFQSCAEGEESWEDHASGNGYFTKNFAAALSGLADGNHDGKLTLMEVCSWTTARTKDQVKNGLNKVQRPYFRGSVSDFTLYEDLNLPKAKALTEEARAAVKAEKYALAIEKFDAALALYPQSNQLKHERAIAQRLLNNRRILNNPKPKFDPMKITVPKDCATIEEAYAKVKDGGIITIEPGHYQLSETLVVNRSVTFRGNGRQAEDVAIDCSKGHTIQISRGDPFFQNLTVSCGIEKGYALCVIGGSPKLFRCIIISRKYNGMYVVGENANPKVESCIVKDCGGIGVEVEKYGHGEFTDCEIFRNEIAGITVALSGNPTFTSCKIHDVKKHGVGVINKGLGIFRDCDIYSNASTGFIVSTLGNPTVNACKIHDGKDTGVFVFDNGLGNFNDCEIFKNTKSGITVESSGNPTFTECRIYDEKRNGVLVLKNGLGNFRDCDIYGFANSGITVETSGNSIFTRCNIHDGKWIGIFVWEKGLGKFNNCSIYEIEGAGIAVSKSGNPIFTKCSIYDVKNAGVGIHENGLGKFINCEISGCIEPGIVVDNFGNPIVIGCKIYNGRRGVLILDGGKGTFNNNILENNYYQGKLANWVILPNAGNVTGSGNTPPIPAR
ncbi:MAG: right-handed parallel beta-helix repeat-containing protein [Thermoguttaceae bacterium]|nr:right-handed parallel beta-helix repeat-containing protein [Thermoguttaceae bacterium]